VGNRYHDPMRHHSCDRFTSLGWPARGMRTINPTITTTITITTTFASLKL
jgi:hypothetical protein